MLSLVYLYCLHTGQMPACLSVCVCGSDELTPLTACNIILLTQHAKSTEENKTSSHM
jgi:hypothetical protein